jgi:hypothetical protein
MIVAVQRLEPAEHAAARDVHGEAKARDAAALRAALVHGGVPLHGLDHGPALGDRERDWFFTVDILAGFRRLDGKDGVPVVGRSDQHRVNVVAGENLPKIGVRCAVLVAVRGIDQVLGRQPAVRIDVAYGQHLHVLERQEALEVVRSLATHANRPHRNPPARRRLPRNARPRRHTAGQTDDYRRPDTILEHAPP